MKKFIFFLIIAGLLSGCAVLKPGYRPIKDYSERMELLKDNFPEIYDLFRQGKVSLDDMYEYKTKEGTPRIHISYRYK